MAGDSDHEVRILDRSQTERLLSYSECLAVLGSQLRNQGAAEAAGNQADDWWQCPLRQFFFEPGTGSRRALVSMAAATPSGLGSKVVAVAPGNRQRGLDTHQGVIVVLDDQTGLLRGVVDGSLVTEVRTGVLSALAAMTLSPPPSWRRVAVLGTGAQAHAHARALVAAYHVEGESGAAVLQVALWGRRQEKAVELKAQLEREINSGVSFEVCQSPAEAVSNADVVATCTASASPILADHRLLRPGAVVCAVGACVPEARELDTDIMVHSTVLCDRLESLYAEGGDYLYPITHGLATPTDIPVAGDLPGLLCGAVPSTAMQATAQRPIRVFKCLGYGAVDVVVARHLLDRAAEEAIGTVVPWM